MMKKVNNSVFLKDLVRILHGEFRLYRMLDLNEADGTWSGIRPDEFEIAIRLASEDQESSKLFLWRISPGSCNSTMFPILSGCSERKKLNFFVFFFYAPLKTLKRSLVCGILLRK